ncbi:sensor histidine kinase [Nitrosomonas nitrosa]|uniref:sensor histidine kinase n=1 Tax=Nitrosomonas nitrosa TaxID=52442 RepID=UPI0023F727E3|nr:ATP-binding protein [Nitrosomonas nitrosa]MCO6435078.1 hypothetical protein [Nitrosomonas nitrosa]
MEPDVITTIPLGSIIFLATSLIAVGAVAGWLFARSRWHKKLARVQLVERERLHDLLNVLPFGALLTTAQGGIYINNSAAAELLTPFGRGDTVPLTIDAAIERVTRLCMPETIELFVPGSEKRTQVLIAPFGKNETAVSHAIVLFLNPAMSGNRDQIHLQLISAIGHELRTPLTAVIGHTEIMNSCQIDEEMMWRRSLNFVTVEVERLARLVEDLLQLSRLDMAPPYLRPTNLRLIAEESLSTLFDRAQEQGVNLMLQAPNQLPRVQADADRMRQVFLNLIDNAIKYAPGSSVIIQMELTGQRVAVEIRDTGPGIPADDLPHLFEPFYRGNQTKSTLGTGLGLTIVKSILDQHHTPLQVDSQPGKGTSFSFFLPLSVK